MTPSNLLIFLYGIYSIFELVFSTL